MFDFMLISSSFADYSTIFNGNVVTMAKAVVCPLDAEDVSKYDLTRSCLNDVKTQSDLI